MNKQLGLSKKKPTRQNHQQFNHARMKGTSIFTHERKNQREDDSSNTAPLHFGKRKYLNKDH